MRRARPTRLAVVPIRLRSSSVSGATKFRTFDKMTLRTRRRLIGCSTLIAAGMAFAVGLRAETGYDLWLRYARLTDPIQRASYRRSATAIVVQSRSPTSDVIAARRPRGLRGLLGSDG